MFSKNPLNIPSALRLGLLAILAFSLSLASCKKEGSTDENATNFNEKSKEDDGSCEYPPKTYGIFKVSDDETSAAVNGLIVDQSIDHFNTMMAAYPNVKTLNLGTIDGSDVSSTSTSDKSLDLGRAVYNAGLNTHVISGGDIVSGGVDLFASGRKVTMASNVKQVGVHSWNGDAGATGWDLRADSSHAAHQIYLRYYEDIGMSKQKAKEFYFFTITKAKPEGMHPMTAEELKYYLLR